MNWLVIPILSLGFLIFIHELGHFLAARLVKVKVDEFSLGFPPRIFKKIISGTQYSLGLIFLGGFVRLRGQNLDDEDPSDPTNYAAKSKSARFLIIFAGPLFNIVLSIILMTMAYKIGFNQPTALSNGPVVIEKVEANSSAQQIGLQNWDQIIEIDGNTVTSWNNFYAQISQKSSGQLNLLVNRDFPNGQNKEILEFELTPELLKNFNVTPYTPAIIGKLEGDYPAKLAGLKSGDQILQVDDTKIISFSHLASLLQEKKDTLLNIKIERSVDGVIQILDFNIKAKLDTSNTWRLGFSMPTSLQKFGWKDSVNQGFSKITELSGKMFEFLGNIFTNNISTNDVGGPIMIAKLIGSSTNQGLADFLIIIAFISFQLGFLNLLPLPVLDGGHIVFLIYEFFAKKAPSIKVRYYIQLAGMIFLFGLMALITLLDINKL